MNRQDLKYLRRLFAVTWRENRGGVISLLVMVTSKAATAYVGIVGMGILLDGVYAGLDGKTLFRYALGILLGTLICSIVGAGATEAFNRVRDSAREVDAGQMNRKSLLMDYEYLEDTHVQELRSRNVAKSRLGVRGWFLYTLHRTLQNMLSVLIAAAILLSMFVGEGTEGMNREILGGALLLGVVIAALLWESYKIGVRCVDSVNAVYDTMDSCFNKERYYMELFQTAETQKDLRINRQQEKIDGEMETICGEVKAKRARMNIFHIRRVVIGVITSDFISFLVYAFIGICAFGGLISIGSVVVYAASIVELTRSAVDLAKGVGSLKDVSIMARDYLEYMDLKNRKPMGKIPVEKRRDNRFSVSFEHVSFRYPGSDTDVIRDLNLSFEIGERMAIVGKNGSGKTTFIKLLCRLYDATEGIIKVNGIDIRKYDYEEYCRLFSVVFQDFGMFAFPLGENIASSDEVDEGRVLEALEKVGLMERFRELPEGLSTYVGKDFKEKGVNFSGGEKQKMAIARAIYKDAPFVIMDEPTAALDPLSECEVYEGFDKMVGNKTAIYISHRLASCRFCQDIMVFDRGKVVQRGSHDQLKGQEGLYRSLWNAQAQYYK